MNSTPNSASIPPSLLRRGAFISAAILLCTLASTVRAQTPVLQINAGGGAVAPFVADTGFNTGNAFSSTATISLAGATNPAPAAVYQSVRWAAAFNYTLGGLTAGNSYLVRLHFVELSFHRRGPAHFQCRDQRHGRADEFRHFRQRRRQSCPHP